MTTSIQKEFKVKNGMAVRNTATFSAIDNFVTTSTDVITSLPSLNLNFLTGTIDPRISFTRASGATYVGKNGYIQYVGNNTPRIDYSSTSTGTALGILIEDSRTNLFTYSSQYDLGVWALANGTVIPNATVAPDNTNTAYKFYENTLSGHSVQQGSISHSASTTMTLSVFAKAAERSTLGLVINDDVGGFGVGRYGAEFDLINGTASNHDGAQGTYSNGIYGITPYGNGWYRCYISCVTSSEATCRGRLQLLTTTTWTSNASYVGNGVSGFYLWGAQMENGYFPTSYIPTTSAQATRPGDYVRMTGPTVSSAINPNAGTIYIEFDTITNGRSASYGNDFPIPYDFDNQNAQSDGYWMLLSNGYGPGLSLNIPVTGVSNQGITIATTLGDQSLKKFATAFQKNDMAAVLNGAAVQTVTNVTVLPTGIDRISIGTQSYVGGYGNYFTGHVRKLAYYPQRLSNNQIQTLTSSTVFSNTNFAGVISPATHSATTSNFKVTEGLIVPNNLEVPDVDKLYITNLTRPTQQASLNLNFLKGTLDPRISFTRASGATVVGPNGYIQYVGNDTPRFNYSSTSTGTCLGLLIEEQRTNLCAQVGVNWTAFDLTYASNNGIVSPDNSVSSILLKIPASLTVTGIYNNMPVSANTVYTWSIYIKLGTMVSSDYKFAVYDVTNSVFVAADISSPILLSNSSWNRLVYTFTTPATCTNIRVYAYRSSASGAGGTVYVWGSQLEQGSFATSYIPTVSVSTVTRATEYAGISGQNLYSWFNPKQGTIYTESDSITTATQTGAILDISDISDASRISMYRQSDKQPVVQYYIPSPLSNVQIGLGAIWTDLSVRKLGTSYSANNFYIASNAVTSSTITSGAVPGNISKFSIGSFTSGANPANGHIRHIVYYPEQLANTATQSLTAI